MAAPVCGASFLPGGNDLQWRPMAGRHIHISTSGWHYPGGAGAWDGVFYPPRGRRHRPPGFDELEYYAEHFDTVEVNSTFYGVPRRAVTEAWAARTPDDFTFSVKLYQKFTHPKMFAAATGSRHTRVDHGDVEQFRDAIAPLHEAGKLGALLAQFPASFRNDTAAHDHLAWLIEALSDCPVAVELRHRSWSDDVAGTLRLLNGLGAAWVQIDEPKFRLSIAQNHLPNVESFYYMRLHGRNAGKWWRHDHAEERYDYHYSPAELQPFRDTADAAARLVKRLYLYMNNHFAAKSVANAATLRERADRDAEEAVEHYLREAGPSTRRGKLGQFAGFAGGSDEEIFENRVDAGRIDGSLGRGH